MMNKKKSKKKQRPEASISPEQKKGNGLRMALDKVKYSKPEKKDFCYPIKQPFIPPGVVPKGSTSPVLAMDTTTSTYSFFNDSSLPGGGFPGFPYLAQLATRSEYRAMASALSTELTREWIEFTSKQDDDDDTSDKIKKIEEEFKRLKVREVVRAAAEHDCLFGRGQIAIGVRGADRGTPLVLDRRTVAKGSLERIAPVEAIWTTPSGYNTLDPMAPDFYRPSKWFMLGEEIHSSRLMTVVTRPLPDMLKPAFNFAGMSLSQLAEPYVENWLRTRQSVSDLINNFSITALATAMDQVLQGNDDGSDLFTRAELFTATRSNKGLMLLDKDREDIVQINTPLSGLHELQAQAQEHMCSVSRLPAIILTGISPSGLNASSDGEIRVFYDWISSQQESFWRAPIETILKCVQLSLFGEIDPDIGFMFVPLYQMTPKEESDIRFQDSQAAVNYISQGVIDPSEERNRLAKDPASGYDGIDTDAVIVPPNPPDEEPPDGFEDGGEDKSVSEAQHRAMAAAAHGKSTLGIPKKVGEEFLSKDGPDLEALAVKAGADLANLDMDQFAKGLKVEHEHADTVDGDELTMAKIVLDHLREDPKYYTKLAKMEATAQDKGFVESEHPRDESGKFGSGSGGGSKKESDNSTQKEFEDVELFDPNNIEPPHEVRDDKKLDSLVHRMEEEGWVGRPILMYDTGQANQALTGSHRIAAARKAGIEIPILKVDEDVLNYEDENGDTISEIVYRDADEIAEFLKKAGDNDASELMELEHEEQEKGFKEYTSPKLTGNKKEVGKVESQKKKESEPEDKSKQKKELTEYLEFLKRKYGEKLYSEAEEEELSRLEDLERAFYK